jgi:hypothetical protein
MEFLVGTGGAKQNFFPKSFPTERDSTDRHLLRNSRADNIVQIEEIRRRLAPAKCGHCDDLRRGNAGTVTPQFLFSPPTKSFMTQMEFLVGTGTN